MIQLIGMAVGVGLIAVGLIFAFVKAGSSGRAEGTVGNIEVNTPPWLALVLLGLVAVGGSAKFLGDESDTTETPAPTTTITPETQAIDDLFIRCGDGVSSAIVDTLQIWIKLTTVNREK